MNDNLVLITGGSRGIGEGIAEAFAKAGYRVAISFSKNEQKAQEICHRLQGMGVSALSVQLQIENRESVKTALNIIRQKLGEVDVLVNNAAMAQEKPFLTITDEDWNNILGVNLRGPFSIIQEVLPSMIEKKFGRIINLSSIGGQVGGINQIHYACAKAGLIGLTKSISKTYSSYGITCNAIAPGLVSTDMTKSELSSESGKLKLAGIPVGRIGTIEEIGAAAIYLASKDAGYITGQTLNINGGMYFG